MENNIQFLLKTFYVIALIVISLYLWIFIPWGGIETVGTLKDIYVCNEKDEYKEDSIEVFFFRIKSDDNVVRDIRCVNYDGWSIDSLLQYKNQRLTITWEKARYIPSTGRSLHPREPQYSNNYTRRIQDSMGNDIPKYKPYFEKPIIMDYIYVVLVLYVLAVIYCIYLLREWVLENLFLILFVIVSWVLFEINNQNREVPDSYKNIVKTSEDGE